MLIGFLLCRVTFKNRKQYLIEVIERHRQRITTSIMEQPLKACDPMFSNANCIPSLFATKHATEMSFKLFKSNFMRQEDVIIIC